MREIPTWLKELVGKNKAAYHAACAVKTQQDLDNNFLFTVCQEARCPNRGECFTHGDSTIMILGGICTRGCKFCAVTKQKPLPPDAKEPQRVVDFIAKRGIKYLVLTMPTRDDLPDGGAQHIYDVIAAVFKQSPNILVEPLISDLNGKFEYLPKIIESGAQVISHNIETVPSLYSAVRCGADYKRSLRLLEEVKKIKPSLLTKSGLMLGLGETKDELKATFKDLRASGCDLLTLGQYLAPSAQHYPVQDYPEQPYYDELKEYCLSIGFKGVMAGPLVRSSYRAGQLYKLAIEQR